MPDFTWDFCEPEFSAPEGAPFAARLDNARTVALALTQADFEAFLGTVEGRRFRGARDAIQCFYHRAIRGAADDDKGLEFFCPAMISTHVYFTDTRTGLFLFGIPAPAWAVAVERKLPRPPYPFETNWFLLFFLTRLRMVKARRIIATMETPGCVCEDEVPYCR